MAGPVQIYNSKKLPFDKQLAAFRTFKKNYPRVVGNMAVNFFKDSFRRQGFIEDTALDRWQPRKNQQKKGAKRNILVKTGALRRSIRIIRSGMGYVVVGTDLPYAKIHNEGGTIKGKFHIRQHNRRAFTRTWKGKRQKVKASTVTNHTRKVNTRIPQRKFIGLSPFLIRRIGMNTEYELRKILNIR